jgi:nuclear transport factor 2 (NTF2) superfamily protein
MWKKNDIVTIFGNPVKLEYPIGQARLVKKLSDCDESTIAEQWEVEYLDDEGHTYPALIKKENKIK